jgi:integration host factor subunit beta
MINRIARNCHIPKTQAQKAVNMVFEGIRSSVKQGRSTNLNGFGSFSVKRFGGFTARNPRTGTSRRVAPYKQIVFTPAGSNPSRSRRRTTSRRRTASRRYRRY